MPSVQSALGTESSRKCKLLVVKATERCNLNCSYCYMFNGGDKSYLKRPAVMSTAVSEAMFRRVLTHCRTHQLTKFAFVLHGGEPLVAPMHFYRHFVTTARSILGNEVALRFALQTNGTLITSEWCDLFLELGIELSFSLDGPREDNDRYRQDRRGRGSFDRVIAGWQLAVSKQLRPGLLVVVNPESDPLDVYRLLKELQPRMVDFLLPEATHDRPPRRGPETLQILGTAGSRNDDATPYADWLLRIFDVWKAEDGAGLNIRLFLQVMRGLLGMREGYDVLGTGDIEVLVIESDGEIQPLDGLRYCEDGMANTSLNVLSNQLDEAYALPLVNLYHSAHNTLCATCEQCDIKTACGGGFLPNRYSASRGFDNPSVYCRDLTKLIGEIHEWFAPQVPDAMRDRLIAPIGGLAAIAVGQSLR
jgi:uncharacterized protein